MSTTKIDTADRRPERAPPYPAEKARQGEIILKTTWAKVVFMAGLFGGLAIVLALALYLAAV
jgi:hypothetical protein